MNRICPTEEILSAYLAHVLSKDEKDQIETHLVSCKNCRTLLVEAHEVLSQKDIRKMSAKLRTWGKGNKWLLGSLVSLLFSFLISNYFFQLLVISLLMGAKWMFDSKNTKMLITIHEAWKRENPSQTSFSEPKTHFENK